MFEAIAFAFVFLGFGYYFLARLKIKVSRALYILLGVSPIGLFIMLAFAFSGLAEFLIDNLALWPSFIINLTVPYIIGAFIGDWIGRKRGYRLSLSFLTLAFLPTLVVLLLMLVSGTSQRMTYATTITGATTITSWNGSVSWTTSTSSSSTWPTTTIIPVVSELIVHVVDDKGIPVTNAKVFLNTSYPNALTNLSGTTDSNGNVVFDVTPWEKCNVTVIPPASVTGGHVVVTVIRAAPPTTITTATVVVPEFPASIIVVVSALSLATLIINGDSDHKS